MVSIWWRREKQNLQLAKIFFLLLVILCAEIGFYYFSLYSFNSRLLTYPIKQSLSFPYYLKIGFNLNYIAVIGDMNGLNKEGYRKVLALTRRDYNKNESFIFVPSLMPGKAAYMPVRLTPADFIKQTGNTNGVILVDNFCVDNWEKLEEKSIYKNSGLSPGPFCGSEPETQDLNRLLDVFNVQKVIIVYDTPEYKDFICNFINYLKTNSIDYEFVQSRQALEKKL